MEMPNGSHFLEPLEKALQEAGLLNEDENGYLWGPARKFLEKNKVAACAFGWRVDLWYMYHTDEDDDDQRKYATLDALIAAIKAIG